MQYLLTAFLLNPYVVFLLKIAEKTICRSLKFNSVLICKYCTQSCVTGMVARADTYLPLHRRAPQMCHSPCLSRAGSVPWKGPLCWVTSHHFSPARGPSQPVEQSCGAGVLQRNKLRVCCGQDGAGGMRNGSRWEVQQLWDVGLGASILADRHGWGRAGFTGGSQVKREGVRSPTERASKEKERGASKP